MERDQEQRTDAAGLTDISAPGWWEVAKRVWQKSGENNLGLLASGIAFNAFLAFVPLLTAVVLSYGLIAAPEQVAGHIATLSEVMPQDAAGLIGNQLENMVDTAGSTTGMGLVLALGISLYGATRGASGVIVGLNIIFGVEESRPYLRHTGVAIAITLGLVLAFLLASVGISALTLLEELVPDIGGAMHAFLQIGFWLVSAVMVSVVIALIYRLAPNREEPARRWLTPGSLVATVVWVAATFAFAFYVRNFGGFNATYGALGAVIIFLMWLYLSCYILLLGAELNAVLERKIGRSRRGDR